jgi:DNA polymerase-1
MYLNHKDLSKYWILDIEADSLAPTVIWCCVLINCATEECVVLRTAQAAKEWFEEHKGCYFIGHFALSYDIPVLRRLWECSIDDENVIDTVVLSYLYHPNMPRPKGLSGAAGPHSLQAWGLRFNFPKGDFHDFSCFSEEMLSYCIQDCKLTLRVFRALTQRMRERGFSELSCWIEHRIRPVIDQQQRNGFHFDVTGANKLVKELREKEQAFTETIQKLFPKRLTEVRTYKFRVKSDGQPYSSYYRHLEEYPKLEFNAQKTEYTVYDWEEFNIGSPKQRVSRLLEFGWTPTKFTKPSASFPNGQPQADEDSIVTFSELCGEPGVAAIASWLVCNGRANMLETWLNSYNPETGCIHGRVFSCGAGTRRMTHNSPNTANIPAANEGVKYGKEVRQLWAARPKRVLVGVDMKSAQMRIFAHYLQNEEATKLYVTGDPHVYNAEQIGNGFGKPAAKKAYYSFILGAGALKLGADAKSLGAFGDVDAETAGKAIKKTLKKITPGLAELLKTLEKEWKANNGWLTTLDGGLVRCPSSHMCLCYKIQPGEAVIGKLGSIRVWDTCQDLDYLKVGDIHDEWQFDCLPEHAEELGKRACAAITWAAKELGLSVPFEGDYKVGATWAETH